VADPGAPVADRVAAVRAEVAAAAQRAGRDPADVTIVAVGKTFRAAALDAALAAGLADVGENYVQEARAKRPGVRHPARWHLIGGLQRNKVRAAVALFDRVHTVDSAALGAALAAEVSGAGRVLPVLVQVNLGGEPRKRGVPPEEVEALAATLLRHPELPLDGLMTVPPPGDTRPYLRLLREVRDRAASRLGVELPHLSMGMSDDFVAAVEEGATLLRLGRVLFGARGPRQPGS
jgi:pyridoxal phosphate enzyme (YggS family)